MYERKVPILNLWSLINMNLKKYNTITVQHNGFKCIFNVLSDLQRVSVIRGGMGERRWMDSILKDYVFKGDYVLDVGAGLGLWTIPLGKHVGREGKVFSIEPAASLRKLLLINISKNDLCNVKVIPKLILKEDRKCIFYHRVGREISSIYSKVESNINYSKEVNEIKLSTTIDNLIIKKVLEPVDFMKIDVEGAEIEVLKGMTNNLSQTRAILVETHFDVLKYQGIKEPLLALQELLQSLGFVNLSRIHNAHLLATK